MNEHSKFKLYYWPIPFRGNFIRCMLSFCNVQYNDATVAELLELKSADMSSKDTRAIFMAPPLIYDVEEDIFISQMPAIVLYLARKYNKMPTNNNQITITENILLSSNDILAEISKNNGSMMWQNKEEWQEFIDGRFCRWLSILESQATRNGLRENAGYFFGNNAATAVDIILFALIGTMRAKLPEMIPILLKGCPSVMNLCDRLLEESSNLKLLFDEQASNNVYCGGQIEASIRKVLT